MRQVNDKITPSMVKAGIVNGGGFRFFAAAQYAILTFSCRNVHFKKSVKYNVKAGINDMAHKMARVT